MIIAVLPVDSVCLAGISLGVTRAVSFLDMQFSWLFSPATDLEEIASIDIVQFLVQRNAGKVMEEEKKADEKNQNLINHINTYTIGGTLSVVVVVTRMSAKWMYNSPGSSSFELFERKSTTGACLNRQQREVLWYKFLFVSTMLLAINSLKDLEWVSSCLLDSVFDNRWRSPNIYLRISTLLSIKHCLIFRISSKTALLSKKDKS